MVNVRNLALTVIVHILEEHKPSHLVLAQALSNDELSVQDRAFLKKLTIGTVERRITLDHIIDSYSSVKVSKQKPLIRNILRMGVYQLLFMNVPDSAACNESVKLAQKRNLGGLSGFVNGTLRSIARDSDRLPDFSSIDNPMKRMSVEYSVPQWIVEYFVKNYGEASAERAFQYFLSDSLVSIRVNESKAEPDTVKRKLMLKGIEVYDTSLAQCFRLASVGSLEDIDEFERGQFTVQDLSSVMSGLQAEITGKEEILDLCAAPGGKSMHAADRLSLAAGSSEVSGRIVSCDISEYKVSLIRDSILRCGFPFVTTCVNDASLFRPAFEDAFDIVICDVPCSGLGIIGRKPDIKYNITPEQQAELVQLQKKIIDCAVRYLKPGGQLIYSTCTVNRAENEEQVDYIKSKGLKCISSRQLLPGEDDTDGFFFARLIRQ